MMSRTLLAVSAFLALAAANEASGSGVLRIVSISQACRPATPRDQKEFLTVIPSMIATRGKSMCIVKNTSISLDVASVSVGTNGVGDAAIRILFSAGSAKRFDDLQSENVGRTMVMSIEQFGVVNFEVRPKEHADFMLLRGIDVNEANAIRDMLKGAELPVYEKGAK